MLYRVVRPMKREGSRFQVYVRRIPVDVQEKLVGKTLHFPLGETTHAVTISMRAQSIRFSLRTDDPAEVKARNAAADQYLERILRAFRNDASTSLTNSQATALAGRLYRAWAGGEGRERTMAVEQGPDGKMRPVPHDPIDDAAHLEAALQRSVPLSYLDKVLTMALSSLLIGARGQRPVWFEIGKAMMAIDTLVHNFLHRTGILKDCGTPHVYGAACYARGGCAEIIRGVATRIDARSFNPRFPGKFPRFVQHAIWRFCAADGLNLCNGNRIDDRKACQITYCYLYQKCSRTPLKNTAKSAI